MGPIRGLIDAANGRRTLGLLGVLSVALVAANIWGTWFHRRNGGSGLLDYRGAANTVSEPRGPYTAEEALDLVAAWGVDGRREQLLFTVLLDVALPAVGFAFGVTALGHAAQRLRLPELWQRGLVLLPTAYLAADYGENVGITTLVFAHPGRPVAVAQATAVLNLGKEYALIVAVGVIVVLNIAASYMSTIHPREETWKQ